MFRKTEHAGNSIKIPAKRHKSQYTNNEMKTQRHSKHPCFSTQSVPRPVPVFSLEFWYKVSPPIFEFFYPETLQILEFSLFSKPLTPPESLIRPESAIPPKLDISSVTLEEIPSIIREHNLRKLEIILDLDNTLVHTVETGTPLLNYPPERLHQILESHTLVIRPGTLRFLKNLSKFCTLRVFTHGTRDYATKVIQIIDPQNVYFKRQILAPTERLRIRKSLNSYDSFFKTTTDKNLLLIVDDQVRVWEDHHYVLPIKPFYATRKITKDSFRFHYDLNIECPNLQKHYISREDPNDLILLSFNIFRIYKELIRTNYSVPAVDLFRQYRSSLLKGLKLDLANVTNSVSHRLYSYLLTALGAEISSQGELFEEADESRPYTSAWIISFYLNLQSTNS